MSGPMDAIHDTLGTPLEYRQLVRDDEPPVYDHAAEAEELLVPLDARYSDFDRVHFVAQAQAHATLALAAAQSTGNLIAWYGAHPSPELRERIEKEIRL